MDEEQRDEAQRRQHMERLRDVLRQAKAKLAVGAVKDAADESVTEAHMARVAAVQAQREAQQRVEALRDSHGAELVRATRDGAAAVVEASKTKPGPALSVAVAAYLAEKRVKREGNTKTLAKIEVALGLLIEGVGDVPINLVSRDALTAFFERLQRLPTNREKMPKTRGRGFSELTAPGVSFGRPLADNTVNGHMATVSALFGWALLSDVYCLRVNPADGLRLKNPDAVKRREFTPEQLLALFSHETWQSRQFLHPHYYWLMPMAALSGMRLNEICQLGVSDFKVIDGVDVVSCADLEEGRRAKTEAARRLVPIHDDLKRLGLLRYVDELRTQGEAQLFPVLREGRDGHGQAPSKWFGRYRVHCGIDGRQEYVFHSFRHYFIRRRLAINQLPHHIAGVVGHETDLITVRVYGGDIDIKISESVVNAITLPPAVSALIPAFEDVKFVPPVKRIPSRLGARKLPERRIADAAAKRLKRGN